MRMSLSFMTDVLLQRKWFVVWERMVIAWQTENDHFSDGDSNRSQIFWRVPDEVVRASAAMALLEP